MSRYYYKTNGVFCAEICPINKKYYIGTAGCVYECTYKLQYGKDWVDCEALNNLRKEKLKRILENE